MRDVGPPGAVALGDLDGVAEQLLLGLRPQVAEALDRQLALLAAARCATASSKRFIAVWRKTVAIESSMFSASSDSRDIGRVGVLEQAAEDERLAEHRRGLADRQRRVLLEDAARDRERRVHAVAELVRERHHVAALARSS